MCRRLSLEGGHDVVPVFRNLQKSGVGTLFMLAVRTDEFCWNRVEEDLVDGVMLTQDHEGQVKFTGNNTEGKVMGGTESRVLGASLVREEGLWNVGWGHLLGDAHCLPLGLGSTLSAREVLESLAQGLDIVRSGWASCPCSTWEWGTVEMGRELPPWGTSEWWWSQGRLQAPRSSTQLNNNQTTTTIQKVWELLGGSIQYCYLPIPSSPGMQN